MNKIQIIAKAILANLKKFWNYVVGSIYAVKVNYDKFVIEFRLKYLAIGSKNTFVGSFLTAQFPNVVIYIFVYTFLLTGIIPDFKINIYMNLMFLLSILFMTVYSFFNEVLYDSADDMRRTVLYNTINKFLDMFIGVKRPI